VAVVIWKCTVFLRLGIQMLTG
ncbi:hypothetical protein A2U01_0050948, partial [Trifolium medium]|nr:hypothetical protein [Trifolium medium]